MNMEASRLTGKAALAEAIKRLRDRANKLEILMNEIPDELSPEADEALWAMAIAVKRD